MTTRKKIILSIDGGGVRGLIPVRVLQALETRLQALGKSGPVQSYFDLMAGTSAGGLIVAGLTAPKPDGEAGEAAATLDELRNFFEVESRDVFVRDFGARVRRLILNPLGLFDEAYDARPLEKILRDRLGWSAMSSALTRIVLTAYDITAQEAVFMVGGPQNDAREDDYVIWQAVRATTAAPTYFEPAQVEKLREPASSSDEAVRSLIDGGVFAADPAIAAFVEGRKLGWAPEDIVLISIGTGKLTRKIKHADAANWGAVDWIKLSNGAPIISIFMNGQASTASYQADKLLNADEVRYHRIDGDLAPESGALDDARPGNIRRLNETADAIIRDHAELLDELAAMLEPREEA